MEEKRFRKNDEGFVCTHCGAQVLPNEVTSRDHCPFCLHSIHVDINPGDRMNPCKGKLIPIAARPHPKKGFQIIYQCAKCGKIHKNKAALTGVQPDDTDLLIRLTANQWEE